jgi:DNA-binding LacI/PurR family transcriptional regulator
MKVKRSSGKGSTIRDIAQALGVCTATVSNALNGRMDKVSASLAADIRRKADEMGYVKDLTAASLSGFKSHLVDLIIAGSFIPATKDDTWDINPFYGELIFRLEHEARERGHSLSIYTGHEEQCVSPAAARRSDAIVALGITNEQSLARLRRRTGKVIVLDSYFGTREAVVVRTDEEKGAALATERLVQRGCKKLAFVGHGITEFPQNIPAIRYRGARKAADAAGVPLAIVEEWTHLAGGKRAAETVLELKVDGVVTSADILAAGLIEGLKTRGVRIPDDIAVTGYDNLSVARMVTPALTTVDQGLDEKVRAICAFITEGQPGDIRVVDPRLVVRESA